MSSRSWTVELHYYQLLHYHQSTYMYVIIIVSSSSNGYGWETMVTLSTYPHTKVITIPRSTVNLLSHHQRHHRRHYRQQQQQQWRWRHRVTWQRRTRPSTKRTWPTRPMQSIQYLILQQSANLRHCRPFMKPSMTGIRYLQHRIKTISDHANLAAEWMLIGCTQRLE